MLKRAVFHLAFLGLFIPVTVLADALFVYEGEEFETDAQIAVSEGKVSLGVVGSADLAVIFDSAKDAFKVLDHENQQFFVLTTALAKSMLAGIQAIMPQLQVLAQDAELTEKQQQLLEQLTGDSQSVAGSDSSEKNELDDAGLVISATGQTRNVQGLTCSLFNIKFDGDEMDVCTVAYTTVGLDESDQDSLKKLSTTFTELAGSLQLHEAQQLAAVLGKLDGVMLEARNGAGDSILKLKRLILNQDQAEHFTHPSTYVQTNLLKMLSGL